MARLSTLLLAALLDSPALYHAFVVHDMTYTAALTRYLIAALIATLMLWLLRSLMDGYRRANEVQTRAEARRAARDAALERPDEALEAVRADPAFGRRSTDLDPDDPASLDLEMVDNATE